MTQNTIENRNKFYSLYYGQPLMSCFNEENVNDVYSRGLDTVPIMGYPDNSFLELRPLSDITDEEATEVAKFWEDCEKVITPEDYGGWDKELIREAIPQIEKVMIMCAGDYLRSRGFLLPYLDLSIEQILEYGWARIKSQP